MSLVSDLEKNAATVENLKVNDKIFKTRSKKMTAEKQIRANDQRNSMAQHLSQHHPDQARNKEVFSFKVMTTGERPLTRQLREAQKIANDIPSGQLINGRNEHIAPAFQQLAPRDILGRDRGPGIL